MGTGAEEEPARLNSPERAERVLFKGSEGVWGQEEPGQGQAGASPRWPSKPFRNTGLA